MNKKFLQEAIECGDRWENSALLSQSTGVLLEGQRLTNMIKCHYCENSASKTVVWLYDKKHQPANIKLPWCGCDLMTALRKIWGIPYQIIEGRDYKEEVGVPQ